VLLGDSISGGVHLLLPYLKEMKTKGFLNGSDE
jgi:hypothetical protein